MKRLAAVTLVAALAVVAYGGDGRFRPEVDIDAVVPIAPTSPGLQFFGRQDHNVVPGAVTINRRPYVCDRHEVGFKDRDDFIYHLRTADEVSLAQLPNQLQVVDGVVHFLGN